MTDTQDHEQRNQYWDGNLDPFSRRAVSERGADRLWSMAVATFDSPAVRYALRQVGPLAGKQVLELGTGLGCGAAWMADQGARVTGLDVSSVRCRMAKARLEGSGRSVRIVQAEAENPPVATGSMDVVFSRDVLMYADSARVVEACARVLRPGGAAVFIESLADSPAARLFRRHPDRPGHPQRAHLFHLRELGAFGPPFQRLSLRGFYFFSALAFFLLYEWHRPFLYRLMLAALDPLDRLVLGACPGLQRFAWRGAAVYRRGSGKNPLKE